MTNLNLLFVAKAKSRGNDLSCESGLLDYALICHACKFFGPAVEMDRDSGIGLDVSNEPLPNCLSHKGNDGRQAQAGVFEGICQYPIGQGLVPFVSGFPEAAAICADIPIRNIIDKDFKFLNEDMAFIVLIGCLGLVDKLVCTQDKPTVGSCHFSDIGAVVLEAGLVDFCIGFIEGVDIPEGEQLSSGLVTEVVAEADIVGDGSACIEVSYGVGADFFCCLVKLNHKAGLREF